MLEGKAGALDCCHRKDDPVVWHSESDTAKVITHHLSGNRTDASQPRRSTLTERDDTDVRYRGLTTSVTWSRSSSSARVPLCRCLYKDSVCGGRYCNGGQCADYEAEVSSR